MKLLQQLKNIFTIANLKNSLIALLIGLGTIGITYILFIIGIVFFSLFLSFFFVAIGLIGISLIIFF